MAPINIDGSQVQDITIDGTPVQEVTVDGQTVFTAVNLPSGVQARYDATRLSLSNGQSLSTFPDETNNFDLTGSGVTFDDSGINGFGAASFSGSENLSNSSPTLGQPFSVSAIAKIRSGASISSDRTLFDSDSSSFSLLRLSNGGAQQISLFAGQDLGAQTVNRSPRVIVAVFDGSSSVLQSNGQTFSGDVGANQLNGIQLGQSFDDSRGLDGFISEVVVFDRALTSQEISDEESRLKNKFNVTF
jgi:hypothetical protein